MTLVHLHRHSEYSLLDGVGTNAQYAQRAVEMDQPALALTDHGSLAGTLHHLTACRENNILGIPGVEAYFRENRKVQGEKDERYIYFHIVLLAKNAIGWKNLMALTSDAWDEGFYQKPCCDVETLRRYHEGLICGTACLGGWLSQRIIEGDSTGADKWLIDLQSIFGDDLFVEIMPSHLEDQIRLNPDLVGLANDHSVMVCATCDAHAPDEESVGTQDVLLMMNTGQTIKSREEKRAKDEDVFEFNDKTYFLQSEQQVRENFASHHTLLKQATIDESIANTLEIAGRCRPFLVGRHDKLPRFDRGRPDIDVLRELAYEGLRRHGTIERQEYIDRIENELEQIKIAGIAPYLLMVRDIVEWAKSDRGLPDKNGIEQPKEKKPIEVGPGRGSAGGSLVCDSIGITNIDPIAYRLQFERFYNINRRGLPDIDVDFPRHSIDLVEEYTRLKFGKEHVLDVIAHQTFGPRAAIRRVGVVLGLPFDLINDACEQLESTDRSPLEEIRVINSHVDQIATDYPEAWQHMTRIQGQIAGRSEHAAALLVTPPDLPIREVLPIERIGGQSGKMITAWGERAGKGNALISDYGFNKFDWLRVAELDKQDYACDLIESRTGSRPDLDALAVHRDPYAVDPRVMEAFGRGLLTGIFQFSATAAQLTRKMKPTNVFDLAAINALIRPGPRGAQADVRYVARKHGDEETVYWHENLEPYLDYSYGVLVFQEQLIEAVHHLGGLSLPEADNFRKIASKLYRDPEYAREEMGKWYEPIKAGFMANGISEEDFGYPTGGGDDESKPTGIWGNFLSFSDYSFNLAHAAGYALLAYRDMWLKVYYPREFFAAFLSRGLSAIKEKRDQQKEAAVREARLSDFGLNILPPDINDSQIDYTVTEDGIRMGIGSVRNVGKVATKEIISKRRLQALGADFGGEKANVAFVDLGELPYESYADFEKRVEARRCNILVKGALVCAGAFDRFGMRDHYTEEKIDELEREFLSVSLSTRYSASSYSDVIEPRINTEEQFDAAMDGDHVIIAGEVIGMKPWTDSKGGEMCFVDLAYGVDHWSVTFFSHQWDLYKKLVLSHKPLFIRGSKNSYNNRSSVLPLEPEQEGDTWIHHVQAVEDVANLVRAQAPLPV